MVSCVFPGSFDPVTKGHLDLIERASALFDRVTVTVMYNVRKKGAIPVCERVEMLRRVCRRMQNVRVDHWDGLLADYLINEKERIVIRGVRNSAEMEQELQAFAANRKLNVCTEFLFLPANPMLNGVSSSTVREIARFGGDIGAFVPEEVREDILRALSNEKYNDSGIKEIGEDGQ